MMKLKPRIGLLPLFLELYDERLPAMRSRLESFLGEVVEGFEKQGVEVTKGSICRVRPEFAEAVRSFEKSEVDLIVTLHLAYSPSLESVGSLAQTPLPILILDTTMDHDLHYYTRRCKAAESAFGDVDYYQGLVAEQIRKEAEISV